MPQAKPTQVIVHRIELQQSERQMLKEYVEQQKVLSLARSASNAAGPIMTGAGIAAGAYIGIRGYQALVAALESIDPAAALEELMKPVEPQIDLFFGEGGLFSWLNPTDSAEDNPLYQESGITQEELEEGSKKLREERGVLNSILAPFGIAPFPTWL